MLYHLFYPLADFWVVFNVFKYITFRSFGAILTAMIIGFACGPWFIKVLSKIGISQSIREDGPERHLGKEGTPTMGGLMIIGTTVVTTLLWARLDNGYIWLLLGVLLAFGFLGFIDDVKKVVFKDGKGIRARVKFFLQVAIALGFGFFLFGYFGHDTRLSFPFFKMISPDLGLWYLVFAILVITGSSNAVNLTDGLDGLATVPSIVAFLTYGILCYVIGNTIIAQYLQLPYIPRSAEITVFCFAVGGACVGFLWFNTYPAQIFMGDVGSLALGATLGAVAVIAKQEILLILIGGIFVLETISVMTQVVSFKLTGKRIFKMAPLHHHYELKGWEEPKVIVRFWIVSIILALLALSTLKLR